MLRRKIAALELLASNPGTTVAESESAQSAANRMRLELAKLVREAASQSASASSETSKAYRHEEVSEPEVPEAEATPRAGAARSRKPGGVSPAPRPVSIRSAPAWTWQVPTAGLVVLAGVAFWIQRSEEPAAVTSGSAAAAPVNAPAGLGAASAREVERNAILARIAQKGGNAAVAAALRACHMRDLLKEFQSTSGAVLRPGETPVDMRRRCGAFLTVRGLDDAICFPATDANPHPVCPIPE